MYAQMVLQPLTQVTHKKWFQYLLQCNGFFELLLIFRRSRRIHLYRLSWESQASNLAITSARRWRLVILVHTEGSLFLDALLRKSFLHWWVLLISIVANTVRYVLRCLALLQDYTQQPPAQELIAKDLHDNEWKFRHIFRGRFHLSSFSTSF